VPASVDDPSGSRNLALRPSHIEALDVIAAAAGRGIHRQLLVRPTEAGTPSSVSAAVKTTIVTALLAVASLRLQRLLAAVVRRVWRGFREA